MSKIKTINVNLESICIFLPAKASMERSTVILNVSNITPISEVMPYLLCITENTIRLP